MTAVSVQVQRTLRAIPDYPKPGILFQDITPVLRDGDLLREVVAEMSRPFADAGVTHVLGIEARGFILGGAVATYLGAGFVPARKPGKLPWERTTETYDLEYGSDALEAHRRYRSGSGSVGFESQRGAGRVELPTGNHRFEGPGTADRRPLSRGYARLIQTLEAFCLPF